MTARGGRGRAILRRLWESGTKPYGWMWSLYPYAAPIEVAPHQAQERGSQCGSRTATGGGRGSD